MKHILPLVFMLLLWSCKKEVTPVTNDQYMATVKKGLVDSLPSLTYQNLDFSRVLLNRVDSAGLYVVRVPFKAASGHEDFVVVKTNRQGEIQRGKIAHLELSLADNNSGAIRSKSVGGMLVLRSLSGKEELNSPIENGYVTAFHKDVAQRTSLEMAPDVLPEVIITYVRHLDSGFSFSFWCMVQTFFMDSGGGSSGGYYSSFGSDGGPSGGGGGSTGGGGPTTAETILIDKENQDENPAIDIQKYINCFASIPDAGATCSIEIYSDIPVDNDPNAFFDASTGSPGHTFISVTKSNGSQHVTQNVGFYPATGYKSITFMPTSGKLVNNAGHEFNASLSMSLTPAQLSGVLNKMTQQPSQSYDLADYNCTDWALAIFNSVRTTPLEIEHFPIVGMYGVSNASMPQNLYRKLQQLKNSNDPEKANVTAGIYKGYAGGSEGPCN